MHCYTIQWCFINDVSQLFSWLVLVCCQLCISVHWCCVPVYCLTSIASTTASSSASVPPSSAANKDMLDNVRKCKNFLSTLLKLASNQPATTVQNVKTLIQGLVVGFKCLLTVNILTVLALQARVVHGDNVYRNTRNAREFDSCQGIDYKSANCEEKSCQRKLHIANSTFALCQCLAASCMHAFDTVVITGIIFNSKECHLELEKCWKFTVECGSPGGCCVLLLPVIFLHQLFYTDCRLQVHTSGMIIKPLKQLVYLYRTGACICLP